MLTSLSVLAFANLFALASSAASKGNVVLCGQYDTHLSSVSDYTFSTNEWGDDGSGGQCISVSSDDSVFNATWQWSKNPTVVHSFPNIRLNSTLLPIQLSDLAALEIAASWSMAPSSSNVQDLAAIDAAANVVVDMFLDPDPTKANSTTLPKYEVMVWIGSLGDKRPIGFSSSIKHPPTFSLNSSSFILYSGANDNGQFVYSWWSPVNLSNFNQDISPLLHFLWRHDYISESNYLGTVQFGTETFHSTSNVTFSARDYRLNVAAGQPAPSSEASCHSLSGPFIILAAAFLGLGSLLA